MSNRKRPTKVRCSNSWTEREPITRTNRCPRIVTKWCPNSASVIVASPRQTYELCECCWKSECDDYPKVADIVHVQQEVQT